MFQTTSVVTYLGIVLDQSKSPVFQCVFLLVWTCVMYHNRYIVVFASIHFDAFAKVPQPPYTIEGANFSFKPEHRWYYFKDMKIDEVLVFKLYDSDRHLGSESWRCPHTAFFNPTEGTIPRESVEVRTICYFK